MSRPYFNKSIEELEDLEKQVIYRKELLALADELQYRKTNRAQTLAVNVQKKLGTKNINDIALEQDDSNTTNKANTATQSINLESLYKKSTANLNDPTVARLSCWTALEALSPQTYKKPEDLGSGDKYCVAKLSNSLPWTQNERSKKNYKLYYEIILGAVDMDRATEKLISIFDKDEEKQRRAQSKAVIASILVNKDGYVLEDDGISVSSFAWALPLTLNKRFNVLNAWTDVEKEVLGVMAQRVIRQDSEGKPLPLDLNTIQSAHQWLAELFDLSSDLIHPPEFAVRRYHYFKAANPPTCSLLNSFFIEDLSSAINQHQAGTLGSALNKYLGSVLPDDTDDLLKDDDALEQALAPSCIPLARWPMGSDRALALLQQAAVNTASDDLKTDGILSVNGPPGTGKTTLLRDLIAHVVTERASTMCVFDSPVDAFTASGQKISSGGKGFWHIYKLDETIRGHEILVASSNNAAVENISHELPDISSVAREDATYFRTVSDALAKAVQGKSEEEQSNNISKSWGLIAAALGNSKNKSTFSKVFWWDKEAAIRLYLKAAKGDDVTTDIIDEDTGKIIERRDPHIVTREHPPANEKSAKQPWNNAKQEFLKLQKEITHEIALIEEARAICLKLHQENKILAQQSDAIIQAGESLAKLMPPEHRFNTLWIDVRHNLDTSITALIDDKKVQPHWIHRLFRLQKGRAWTNLKQNYSSYCAQKNMIRSITLQLDDKRQYCGEHIINAEFFQRSHEEKQTASPWIPKSLHAKREELFLAALDVHKAFIDASAQKMLHNLSALMGCFQGGDFSDPAKKALLSELWSTLFLVVPVVSTAFASVNKMIGSLPPESLGWLLIDEAGQAVPQAAVGAIMRSKRAMVVGDPMQIQPVVTLPERLNVEICRHFNVSHDIWSAPKASTQTLADQASSYQSAFDTDSGERLVGIPLLVHRRCEDPMFSISNEVAYNKLMVSQVRTSDGGDIRTVLGVSQWFHVDGHADNKWCADEGEVIINLLRKLRDSGVRNPDLFIVTPFRIVAQEMRDLLNREARLLSDLGLDARQFGYKNVGTVHTVQGREADTVILLLGAPMASQNGARKWAGSPENLLNVAVSRAKKNLYVVGSRSAWSREGSFSVLSKYLASD